MQKETQTETENRMENKVIIFDFDGTIADSLDTTVNIYNKLVGGITDHQSQKITLRT